MGANLQTAGSSDGSCLSQDSLRGHLEAEGTRGDKGDSVEKPSSLLTAYRRLEWTCRQQDLLTAVASFRKACVDVWKQRELTLWQPRGLQTLVAFFKV